MQQQMGQFDVEQKKMEEKLYATEHEKDRALAELRAMRKMVEEDTNAKRREELSKQKIEEMHRELNSVKASLANTNEEMNKKDKMIKSLKLELEKAKGLELKLEEELAYVKSSEAKTLALSSESAKRVVEMEVEVEKGKESGTKMFDSLISQMKKLEETQMLLEESKVEIASLHQKVKTLESSTGQTGIQQNGHVGKAMESLKYELNMAKDNLADAEEVGKQACLKANSLINELESLKNELKLATVAEENSKKALDDLALALKEVATEASRVKEELGLAKAELEHSKGEEDRLNLVLKSSEEMYKRHLEEAFKEAEKYKNTAERLRLEAEETLLAWNDKETGLVDCIRKADEERSNAEQEIARLADLLIEAENKTRLSKEENSKLRDILKQALSESNVAKEAMLIAKAENSELKDRLAEKEESLIFISRENDNYRLNEAAAIENINELKRGSIFDVVDSPVEAETDVNHHRKKSSSVFSNEDEAVIQLDDFDNLDGTHFDDLENDRTSRKKKALLRRFGDLLIRKRSFHKKEPSDFHDHMGVGMGMDTGMDTGMDMGMGMDMDMGTYMGRIEDMSEAEGD
uniref:Uncharacterized protein n=1 Tax=Cannabis sativa TaxID=3483 RepID=A0A803PD89_CANSA